MLKTRVIPVLYLMNGLIVRSEGFADFKVIGNPINELERLSEWLADEVVYIDITRDGDHDMGRSDHKIKDAGTDFISVLRAVAKAAFMPLAFGGRVRTLDDVDAIIRNGADKVVICSQAYRSPELIEAAAHKYGSQAVVVGIDVKREGDGHALYIDQGRTRVDADPVAHAKAMEARGAGEILVNSIDRDGAAEGYDLAIIRRLVDAVGVPVVAAGGVGVFSDFVEGVLEGGASAVAAGNIFHFTEHSYKRAKQALRAAGVDVRYPFSG
jgi:cyclase